MKARGEEGRSHDLRVAVAVDVYLCKRKRRGSIGLSYGQLDS